MTIKFCESPLPAVMFVRLIAAGKGGTTVGELTNSVKGAGLVIAARVGAWSTGTTVTNKVIGCDISPRLSVTVTVIVDVPVMKATGWKVKLPYVLGLV